VNSCFLPTSNKPQRHNPVAWLISIVSNEVYAHSHVLTSDTWVRFGARFRDKGSNHWHRL
jgi:hypothetical protein